MTTPEAAGAPSPGVWPGPDFRAAIAVTLLTGAALALRLFHIDAQSVWYDESFAIAQAAKPWGALFDALVLEGGRHPPLHYWLLHVWFGLTGLGAFQARLLSALAGAASVPLLYAVARRLVAAPVALVAALLLTVSQIAVYFSQEARAYMLADALSLATAWACLALLARPTVARSLLLAAAVLALLGTHYYGLGTLAALAVYALLFPGRDAALAWKRLLLAALMAAVFYAPWPLALRHSAEAQPGRIFRERDVSEQPTVMAPLMALHRFNNGKFSSVETESSPASVLAGMLVFTLPVLIACWRLWPERRRARAAFTRPSYEWQALTLGLLLAAAPVALAIAAGVAGATFNYRHYSFAVPGYCLAVAVAWHVCFTRRGLRQGWLIAALVMAALGLRAVYTAPTKPDYRAALSSVAAATRNGDCAVVRPDIWKDEMPLPWDIYYRDRPRPTVVPFAALPGGLATCGRVWVLWDRTWWMNRDDASRRAVEALITTPPPGFVMAEASRHPALEWRLYRRVGRD